jgi:hypothetical protein
LKIFEYRAFFCENKSICLGKYASHGWEVVQPYLKNLLLEIERRKVKMTSDEIVSEIKSANRRIKKDVKGFRSQILKENCNIEKDD